MVKRYTFTLLMLFLACLPSFQLAFAGVDDEDDPAKDDVKIIEGKKRNLTLPLGLSRTLEFPFEVGPINLTDPSVFDYRRINDGDKTKKLLLLPKNPGVTNMTISDSNGVPKISYVVRVTREDVGNVISQLEELLGDIEGLKFKSLGGTIILDGEILLPKDMLRIFRVLDAIKDRDPKKKEVPIRNLATISKLTMNILAERIEREIGSPEITARVINGNLFLEGTAESDFEADRAVEIAKTYLPEVFVEKSKGEGGEYRPKAAGGNGGLPTIVDLLRVRPRQASPPSQDIKITMNYVELTNDYDRNFSFQWKPLATDNSSIKYDSSVGELTSTLIATVSSLFPKLNSARSHGHARILKQEQIIVKDKAESPASIESSIDLYTRITDEKGNSSLQAVPVQNVTKVKAATISGSDSIDVGIQISLNSLVGSNQGQPIVAKNALQTQITVKNGDSAALGGYAVDNAIANYNKDAPQSGGGGGGGGGQTILGLDFQRSKSYKRDKQQYVIFITPEVIRTASAGTEDITRKFRLNAGER